MTIPGTLLGTVDCFSGWPAEVHVYLRRTKAKAEETQSSEKETLQTLNMARCGIYEGPSWETTSPSCMSMVSTRKDLCLPPGLQGWEEVDRHQTALHVAGSCRVKGD